MDEPTVAVRIVLADEVRKTFDSRLKGRSWNDVDMMYRHGQVNQDEWDYYRHRWVTDAFRWSTLGSGLCNWCKEIH